MEQGKNANLEDIMQVIVGASALSVPVAFSEESWNLSKTLPMQNILLIMVLSLLFVNLYSFQSIFQGDIRNRIGIFVFRTMFVYFITLVVVSIILGVLNRMPIFDDTLKAIKRIIILSFPASMGAVVVDSFDKE
jgi:uncharacterized membrane protein